MKHSWVASFSHSGLPRPFRPPSFDLLVRMLSRFHSLSSTLPRFPRTHVLSTLQPYLTVHCDSRFGVPVRIRDSLRRVSQPHRLSASSLIGSGTSVCHIASPLSDLLTLPAIISLNPLINIPCFTFAFSACPYVERGKTGRWGMRVTRQQSIF